MSTLSKRLAVFAFVLALGMPAVAHAQVEPGQTEVLGFVGVVTDGGGATIGGGVQHAFRERLMLAIEAAYLSGDGDLDIPGFEFDVDAFAIDANIHYLFPLEQSERFTPYVLGGIGFLRTSVSASVEGFEDIPGFESDGSDTDVGLNIGGGARIDLNERWILRPELRVLISGGSHVRLTIGFAYALGR